MIMSSIYTNVNDHDVSGWMLSTTTTMIMMQMMKIHMIIFMVEMINIHAMISLSAYEW